MATKKQTIAELLAIAPELFELVIDDRGIPFAIEGTEGNPIVHRIRGATFSQIVRAIGLGQKTLLDDIDVRQVVEGCVAMARAKNDIRKVWRRVAPLPGQGVVIDVGDDVQSRIVITPEGADVVTGDCALLFDRSSSTQPMVLPAEYGEWEQLLPYLNLEEAHKLVFIGWLTFTMAHPKVPSTNYVLLLLHGSHGSGKSALCGMIRSICDPSQARLSIFPRKEQDFVLALQSNHLSIFDNCRGLASNWSDLLCVSCTGGTLSVRQLYENDALCIHEVHGALILNGLESFVDQPDLAERTLPIRLLPLRGGSRKEESELVATFEEELPEIMRGLFDLIAAILKGRHSAKVRQTERMLGFVKWLAAMEVAIGVEPGHLQSVYSDLLRSSIEDSLAENPFAAELLGFARTLHEPTWMGTPQALLGVLRDRADHSQLRHPDWPDTPAQMVKRLMKLESGLRRQGLRFEKRRGRERQITVHRLNR